MSYFRTIRFADTDAAGVVYFASLLSICHEAYEASLLRIGVDMRQFFSGSSIALPIVHAEIDFFQPLMCGDQIQISLKFEPLPASHGFSSSEELNHHDRAVQNTPTSSQELGKTHPPQATNSISEKQSVSEKLTNPSIHKISKFQIIYQLKNANKNTTKNMPKSTPKNQPLNHSQNILETPSQAVIQSPVNPPTQPAAATDSPPLIAQALTRHVAITLNPRRRTTIPAELYPLFLTP